MVSAWRLFISLWESIQVELHGKCSEERVLELARYSTETSWLRVIAVLIFTPLPCLVVTVAVDLLPLDDPSEGISINILFFVRIFYTYVVVTILVVLQFRISVPILPYPLKRVIGSATLVSLCVVSFLYGLAQIIGFLVPFGLLLVTPPWVTFISIAMVVEWARKVRETPGAATMLINSGKLWLCQLLLVFTYPPYFYIFTTLSKGGKTAFALLLPIIKMFMKNILARTVTHLHDEMPEVVVFNCDVFNSLFVSYCMQNSPSIWITLEIMVFDVVMMAFSLRDATSSRKYLKSLEQKIAHQRSLGRKLTTLQRVSILLSDGSKPNATPVSQTASSTRIAPSPILVTGVVGSNRIPSTVVVKPKTIENVFAPAQNSSPVAPVQRTPILEQVVGGSPRLQSSYIRKVQRLVYAAEFLLLLNYVEVIIPLLFSIYLIGMYYLPNGNYYAQIHGMDQTELVATLKSVQFYCSLQLVSLLLLFVALQQILGLSPVHQLAFVLEKQFDGVQIKLVFWVFYNVQASLQHNGYDYKFKFPWLEHTQQLQ